MKTIIINISTFIMFYNFMMVFIGYATVYTPAISNYGGTRINQAIYDSFQSSATSVRSDKSIQIDHLLVSPSGIFLMETKNWSEHSINNLSLFSPVSQIKRASYAIYKVLMEEDAKTTFFLKKHHWGKRKIPVKNLIVMINRKPAEEFEYVKVLILERLLDYIKYFEPIFSNKEVVSIAESLLQHCGKLGKVKEYN